MPSCKVLVQGLNTHDVNGATSAGAFRGSRSNSAGNAEVPELDNEGCTSAQGTQRHEKLRLVVNGYVDACAGRRHLFRRFEGQFCVGTNLNKSDIRGKPLADTAHHSPIDVANAVTLKHHPNFIEYDSVLGREIA